jgi:parallel beta-helix repeat protein
MGRTRIAKAVARDLAAKRETSQKRKYELEKYLSNLKGSYESGKISYSRYVEIFHKKNDGKNISEWIQYYDKYGKQCEREEKKHKGKVIRKKILTTFLSVALISVLVYFFFFTNYMNLSFTGLTVFEQEKEFVQELNLNLTNSTEYGWQLENIGQLGSIKLSGLIEGEGEVKIYLNDLLILDSLNIKESNKKTSSLGITGGAIDDEIIETPISNSNNSYSEQEAPLNEDSSPFQEEPLAEEKTIDEESFNQTSNQSNSEEQEVHANSNKSLEEQEIHTNSNRSLEEQEANETGVQADLNQSSNETETQIETIQGEVNETKEESSPSQSFEPLPPSENKTANQNETNEYKKEIEITIKEFKELCEETCDLENLNLNQSSYTLRIEISNARLLLTTINYEILQEKETTQIQLNETNISDENITITTIQYSAVLGQPVKWKKEISLKEQGPATIELPKEAENIVINKITDSYSEQEASPKEESSPSQGELLTENKEKAKFSITGNVISEKNTEKKSSKNFFKKIFSSITGNAISNEETPSTNEEEKIEVIIEDNSTQYEIEYETPAPYATEEETSKGKKIIVSSPETIHYENVLIFTNLSEDLNIKNSSSIKIYWIENNTYISPTSIEDKDNNGIYDYIEFIAPHLSNQTFEIIVITKALHLDFNKNFINDLFEQVKEQDNIWSETIPDGDYVRITFETLLDNTKDITIYPRTISGTPSIEVYEKDESTLIANFTSITDNEYNKVYLTSLVGTQDTFDLRIVGGSVEFDHIIDPSYTWSGELVINGGFEWGNITGWTANGTATWGFGDYPPNANTFGSQAGTHCAHIDNQGTSYDGFLLYQDVNLTSYADSIDAGNAVINASGWGLSAEACCDLTKIKIDFLFQNKTIISTPINTNYNLTAAWWKVGIYAYSVPVNTRYIRLSGSTYEQDLGWDSGSFDSFSVIVGYEETPSVYNLNLTSPTTSSPANVSSYDNISVYFNFTQDGTQLTSGVSIDSIFIGGVNASIVTSESVVNTWYIRTNDNGAADYNETVSFGGMPNTSYVALANQLPNADVAYSEKFLSKGVTSTQWWMQSDTGTELATQFMWGVFNVGHVNSNGNHIECGIDTDTGSTNAVTFTTSFPNAMYTAICNPGTDVDSPICVVNSGVAKSTTGLSFYLSDDGGSAETTTGGINYCAFQYGEYDMGEVTLKANNMSVTNGVVSVSYDSSFPDTNYVVFITEISPTSDDGCAYLVTGRTTGGFTAIGYDDGNSSSDCDQPINWVAIEKGEFNSSITAVNREFAYIQNIGWQVNVTVPDFEQGLKDLFVNATYSGTKRNDTQTSAIDYEGEEDTDFPYFTKIPSNVSLFYGNESLAVDFDAEDAKSSVSYYVNDTRFSTNSSGFLLNATTLGVGEHTINFTINDSYNNKNWTFYKVQINQSQEICEVLFNETSPIESPGTFLVWANCTSAFVLSRNGTTIENGSEQILGAGAYNFSMRRNDTLNYSYIYNESEFIITPKIVDCGDNLNVVGETYKLTKNVTSAGTCFTVTAANVTIDCNGYWINYSTAGTADTNGVYSNQFNTTIKNCNIVDGNLGDSDTTRYGILFNEADNGTILNNTITIDESHAVVFYNEANFNNLISNVLSADEGLGVLIYTGSIHNNLTSNTIKSYSENEAIYFLLSPYNFLLSNNITGYAQGAYFENSGNNILINNTLIGENSNGLAFYVSPNNTLINNTAITYGTSSNHGISISESSNTTSINQIAKGATAAGGTGINIRLSNNTLFRDCINTSGYSDDVHVSGSSNVSFINCSYDKNKEYLETSEIIRKWYYTAYVNNSEGILIEDANVTAYNATGVLQFTSQTDSLGYIERQEIIEYTRIGEARVYYNNYTIFANKSEYPNASHIFNFTITQNKVDDFFTLGEEEANTPPQIIYVYNSTEMTDISSGPNEGPLETYVQLNFTAYDAQGFGDLNDSSVQVNFSLAGEESRLNTSCALLEDYDTNYANYSCNVTMWWWDAPGTWTINASIEDNNGNNAFNDSTNFLVGSTTGFLANSTQLNWPEINPGASNQEANESLLLNNTGNTQVSVEINATDLIGENNPDYSIGANNFSVHTAPGCEGTMMSNSTYVTVVGATISKGNYSLDDGTAQETIYFCLETSNVDLISQPYSTGIRTWIIRVFLAAFAIKRKKKGKKIQDDKLLKAINLIADELREEYSLNKKEVIEIIIERLKKKYDLTRNEFLGIIKAREGITIPITIFTKELGALESLTKYMKENLNMNYRDISKELGRNERTIWTAYKKANEKQKEPIKIKETEINLPTFIFEDNELTILESIVIYLKKEGKRYSEIGELLYRDQRNIWTIYSRAIKKLKMEEK